MKQRNENVRANYKVPHSHIHTPNRIYSIILNVFLRNFVRIVEEIFVFQSLLFTQYVHMPNWIQNKSLNENHIVDGRCIFLIFENRIGIREVHRKSSNHFPAVHPKAYRICEPFAWACVNVCCSHCLRRQIHTVINSVRSVPN